MDLIRSSVKIFLARFIGSVISFLAITIFSRELGASPLGTYYPFLALMGLLAIPSDFGIRSAVEKRLSEREEAGSYLGSAILLKIPPLIIVAIIISLAERPINQYLGSNLSHLLIVVLFVREAAQLSLFVLRGELRVGETAIVEMLRPLGWLGVGYAFYTQGYGVKGLIYGYLAGVTAMLIVGWWKVSTPVALPTIQQARSLLEYGRYSVISSIGTYFYSWMDVAMLTLFVTLGIASTRSEIGAYENAWRLSLFIIIFSQAISTVIFPQISRWDAEEAIDRIEATIPKALFPALLIVVPAFIGTVVLAKAILRLLFGPEFVVAWLVLIILVGEKIIQAIHVILGRCLQAVDRPDLAAYATIVAVFINLVLNIILIWHFGIVGAALATTISFAANTYLHAYYLRRFIDIRFPTHVAAWSVGAAAVMGISVFWLKSQIAMDSMIDLVLIILFGVIVYVPLALAYTPIRVEVRKLSSSVVPGWVTWNR